MQNSLIYDITWRINMVFRKYLLVSSAKFNPWKIMPFYFSPHDKENHDQIQRTFLNLIWKLQNYVNGFRI